MEFKDRLKEIRHQKHLSQQQLADLLGMTKQAVSHYERGTRKPTPDKILAMSDVLNVSTDYLLGNTDQTARFLSSDMLFCVETLEAHPILSEVIRNEETLGYLMKYAEFLLKQ